MSIIDYPDNSTNGNALVLTDGSTQLQVTSGTATQSGVISESGGSFELEKIGSGTLIFTADNTYTGVTTISGGTLQIGNGGPSGTVLGNIVNNSLLVFNHTFPLNQIAYSGIISGTGALLTSGALILTGANTYTGGTTIAAGGLTLLNGGSVVGDIVNNGSLQLNQPSGYTLYNNVSGTGFLSVTNTTGIVTLLGTNTYTGGTQVSSGGSLQIGNGGTSGSIVGDIDIGNGGTVIFNRSDDITFAGSISLNGTIVKLGAGALVLSGPVFYGDALVDTGATLQFGVGGAAVSSGGSPNAFMRGISNDGSVIVNYSNDFRIGGAISGNGSLSQIGTGTLLLGGENTYSGGTIISAGTLQVGDGGISGTLGTGAVTDNSALVFSPYNNMTVANVISGTGSLTKTGNAKVTLISSETYTGGTTISAGTLQLGFGGTLASTGALTINGGTFELANALVTTVGALSGTGGNIILEIGNLNPNSASDTSLATVISGIGSLNKSGTGTLTLTGANTYSGGTFIFGGTIKLGASNSLPTGGLLVISDGATLDLNNKNQTVGPISGAAAANILLGSGTLSVVFGGTAGFNGVISGTGSLIKGGFNGTFTLAGNNTYSGGTTINGGALVLGSGGASGSIVGDVIDNASLVFLRSDTTTFSGIVSGSGTVVQAGTGTQILTGTNTYTGATTVSRGTLLVDGAIASSAATVANGATLGGAGTVGATSIQSGGRLAPGDGIGTLQVNGNLTLASGALFAEELSPGAADEIIVNGNASIAGNLSVTFSGNSYGHQTYTLLHSTGTLSGTFANFSTTGLPTGLIAGLTYGAHDVTLTTDHVPAAVTANISAVQSQSLALSSLVSVSDTDGDAITGYQLWDSTRDPNSGHFEINGVAQPAGAIINVSAAQLAQTAFIAGSVGDSLQIRAFDGYAWSAADTAPWAPFTVSIRSNSAPSLSTTTQRVTAGQSVALSSLATVTDADGDTITRYQLWDSTRDPNSGHWVVNGQTQAAGTVIDITAAQLGQTFFVAGTVNDNLQIRAFDGIDWSSPDTASWAPFAIGPLVNNAPVVQTSNRTIARGVTTALSSLIAVSDADSDAITQYQLWDSSRDPNSGHFVVNNVVQAAGTVIDISAAQLNQTSFVTGSLGDSLQIRAFDGISWSAADTASWSPFTVSVPDAAPVVSTSNVTRAHLQSYALSSLFSVTDADGDAMTRYQLWDSTRDPNSGHFVINGQVQSAGTVIDITAAQLAQTSFFTGTVGDNLQIRAFDGIAWSDADTAPWAPFTVSIAANNPPVVSTGSQNAMHGRTLALSSLFSVTDADGDTMTKYQLWDSIRDPLSGHFVVNGVVQAAGTVIDITAAELNQTFFVTGQVSDSLQIRAFDGINWSDADNAPWQPCNVSVTPYTSPSMSTQDVSVAAGQSLALSGLISVTDLDGDSMTRYELWDSTRDPNSGSWVVNGQVQAAGTVIDITAAQLAQTSFLAGTVGITDGLQVRAFDGISWTAGDAAAWAPFHVTAT